MDARLQRIKELIEQKEQVDAELENLLGGSNIGYWFTDSVVGP